MDKTEIIVGVLENLDFAARHCHLCPSKDIDGMVKAVMEADKAVSKLSGMPHVPPPGGEGGSPAARFYILSLKEKVQSLQFFGVGARGLSVLTGVLGATRELCRGLDPEEAAPQL